MPRAKGRRVMTDRGEVTLPPPPEPGARFAFPIAATVAPVLASVAIWLMTQSPFALLFALLGPVVALASLADSSWHGRRHRRRALREYEKDMTEVVAQIDRFHQRERSALETGHPDLPEQFTREQVGVDWHRTFRGEVRIGRGRAPSSLRLSGATDPRQRMTAVRDAIASVQAGAPAVEHAPITADAFEGIGFVGPALVADAAARGCVVRLAAALDPTTWSIATNPTGTVGGDGRWAFVGALPHASSLSEPPDGAVIEFVESPRPPQPLVGARTILVWSVRRMEQLPRRCRTVVVVPPLPRTMPGDRPSSVGTVESCEFVGTAEAGLYAQAIHEAAVARGMVTASTTVPSHVPLSALENTPAGDHAVGLACAVGIAATGPWSVDLVGDGPHAVIGGTTGSGKSELLTSWILAMAARYGADDVTFLLVDFKGGATFDGIAGLPHSVGVITDLDHRGALRAIESLRAEVLGRERALAERGIRSIEQIPRGAGGLARLVIVVDEFAALAGEHPDLHTVFSDLASRGRSLGIHLILCTQRPAASLRDAILANCTLRVCLRVNDAADSVSVIGSPDAALLPRAAKGRALVSAGGEAPVLVQVAIAAPADADAIVTTISRPVRRPWCDPLPTMIEAGSIASTEAGLTFGMVDVPVRQLQEPAVWNPSVHGNLLVVGAFASGKSTLVATLASAAPGAGALAVRSVPRGVEQAWDAVSTALDRIDRADHVDRADLVDRAGHVDRADRIGMADRIDGAGQVDRDGQPGLVMLLDDIDATVARFGRDHQLEFTEKLTRLLRDGPGRGVFVAMTARSIPSLIAAAASACDTRVILRMPDRADHVAAGGPARDFDERMPPGGGFWRGDRVQVARGSPPRASASVEPPVVAFPSGRTTAIISSAPSSVAARIATDGIRVVPVGAAAPDPRLSVAAAGEHLVLLGDPDTWGAAWSLLPSVRSSCPLVFHGCSVADYRAITRSRLVPPALDGGDTRVWLLRDDVVERARLPA